MTDNIETHALYDGAVTLYYDDGPHTYFIDEGVVGGVTNTVRMKAEGWALTNWRRKTVAGRITGQFDNLTKNGTGQRLSNGLIFPGVAYTEDQLAAFFKEGFYADRQSANQAADLGKKTHDWIEAWVLNAMDKGPHPGSSEDERINEMVRGAIWWFNQVEARFHAVERVIYSRRHGYAGRMDLWMTAEGRRCSLNLKSSNLTKGFPYDGTRWAEEAYRRAIVEETGIPTPDRRILRLDKQGNGFDADRDAHILDPAEGDEDFECFLACLTLKKRELREKDRKRGAMPTRPEQPKTLMGKLKATRRIFAGK